MTTIARGTFEVSLTPQALPDAIAETALGVLSIEKQFHGGLAGTSRGLMLSTLTAVEGSAGYVAQERVTGTLDGRSGSFVLQHSGTMARGAQGLTISVVPDSGTGELVGLSGTMTLQIADGAHAYELSYTLAPGEE
jgi:hypothetical protein